MKKIEQISAAWSLIGSKAVRRTPLRDAGKARVNVTQCDENQTRLGDVCVLGMGKTGEYVARYCAARLGGRVSSVTLYGGLSSKRGDKSRALESVGVKVMAGCDVVEGSYDLTVSSPGISEFSSFFCSARACSREIISEPEFAWRESPDRWVGITGTNGKTTTTTLTTALLHGAGKDAIAVGNIGYLATSAIKGRDADEWFVAELSSFQLACSQRLHPRVAALLNITADHLAWHHSFQNYTEAKERIFQNLTPSDLAIVSDSDAACRVIAGHLAARHLRVCTLDVSQDPTGPNAAFTRDGLLIVRLDGREHELVQAEELRIKGDHNVENVLAAAAIALELGCDEQSVCRNLVEFSPLEHRIEPCGECDGVAFVNDSKATNTDAVEKALMAFEPGSVILLAGGHDKKTDLSDLAKVVCRDCAAVICYGEAGPRIAAAVEQLRARLKAELFIEEASHMADAFQRATRIARSGQTILLSPACSSFDEFKGFEERGRVFKRLVADYIVARKGA
ncbi:MAG: UDP-N-acetylmuramoyl-L-alanine--D-glutamate ligase [Atopobium sp.]|nr:UDP-N-acetylmuramoyl-L-alanine--D-glutamate ligase [Atopobium sp.]